MQNSVARSAFRKGSVPVKR